MALKTVTGKITRADGVVGAVSLRIVLSAPAVIAGTQELVPAAIDVTVAPDGTWSQQLQANLDLLPPTTYYTGFEAIGGVTAPFVFVVPQSAGPFKLADILAAAPASSPPAALDSAVVHIANPETITGDKTFAGSMIEGKDFHRSAQSITEAVLVSGIDATAGELVDVTLTANRVVGLPLNPAVGQELVLLVTMGGTGGYKLTYPAGIKTAWQPASAVGDISALRLRYFGTNWQQIGGQVAVSQLGVLAHRGPAVVGSLTVRDPSSSGPYTNKLQGSTALDTPAGIVNGTVWDFGGAGYHIGQFGARFDAVTDDTVAWQAFVDFITNKTGKLAAGLGGRGLLPPGISIVSSAGAGVDCVQFTSRPGWWIQGAGAYSSVIRCATDNAPIFHLAADAVSSTHTYGIDGLKFDYVNAQPSANTTATPIRFGAGAGNGGCFQGSLTNIVFARGGYAMTVDAGANCPWGQTWDNLQFTSGLSIGAYDNTGSTDSGVPNNRWGRISVNLGGSAGMVGPVFNNIRGYDFVIDTLEFFNGPGANAQLFLLVAGSTMVVNALKLECSGGSYTATPPNGLFQFLISSSVRIGTMSFGGSTLAAAGAGVVVIGFNIGTGGGSAHLYIGVLDLASGIALSGGAIAYVFQASTTGSTSIIVEHFNQNTGIGAGWILNNAPATPTAECLTIRDWVAGHLSANKGDADYAIVLGDPNVIDFSTAFGAARTVTLPGVDATLGNLPNGLWYRIRFKGALGAFGALIKCNAVTLVTLVAGTGDYVLEFTYRRSTIHPQTGWVLTEYMNTAGGFPA